MASSVNLRSGLVAVGALRPSESGSQEPVALETTVIATGARPGDSAAKRSLFTEETQTVLVFERGAVIRLSAAVADGQLLFLTNKATGKEIVAQVLRKRSFRPTNCYVDLEFTEDCPGFWGIEFPKSGAPSSPASSEATAPGGDSDDAPAKLAIRPDVREVERLKQEVNALQTQLKTLMQPAKTVEAHLGTATPATSSENSPGQKPEPVKAAAEIGAEVARREEEKQLEELFALEAKQEESKLPKRLVAYPQKMAKVTEEKEDNTGSGKTLVAVVAISVLAIVLAYQLGALNFLKKPAVKSRSGPNSGAASNATVPPATPSATTAPKSAASASALAISVDSSKGPVGLQPAEKPAVSEPVNSPSDAGDIKVVARPATPNGAVSDRNEEAPTESKRPSRRPEGSIASSRAKRSATPSSAAKLRDSSEPATPIGSIADAVAAGTQSPDYVAPKLIKGSKAVEPPEAILNYVSGDVTMDAVIDTTGHVRTVTVLSGPAKLYSKATEVLKSYFYEPATKNGKPVPAHVQISLQFWYTP